MTKSSTPKSLDPHQLKAINQLIDKIAARQLQDFGRSASETKADGTLITECDKWSDENIVHGIAQITEGEKVLSEEGNKIIPDSSAFWVVDPIDGTTNFAAGIPYWAISMARFVNGSPESAFLDIPSLKKRLVAIKDKGVWLNNKKLNTQTRDALTSECVSLCSRSIRILQMSPQKKFPGKIRLLGVSSLNMTSVALGQTVGALEATPKIWDLAAAWLILSELDCIINWLDQNPKKYKSGDDLSAVNFPLLVASSSKYLEKLSPWADVLMKGQIKT